MSKLLPPRFEVSIEKMNTAGQGVGRFGNRQVRVWGAVPGDTLSVRPLKKKRGAVEAALVEVLKPSLNRRPADDSAYISSAPWLPIAPAKQAEYKLGSVQAVFREYAGCLPARDPELAASPRLLNYRNKMEYSFTLDDAGRISLALHQRQSYRFFYALESSRIAHERLNDCARSIIAELNRRQTRINGLKYLVLRYSYLEDKCLAALYVNDPDFAGFTPELACLKGWKIFYSDPESPATTVKGLITEAGETSLVDRIGRLDLRYDLTSFFQINPPAFSGLLSFVSDNTKPGRRLVDMYAGVGTIGLNLSGKFKQAILVESDEAALACAEKNIAVNNIKNVQVRAGFGEKLLWREFLGRRDTLIVDPPRSGLHPKALRQILEIRPRHFIYVSCQPLTQARDFKELKKIYNVRHWRLFDLYPHTPHCESVLILQRKWWS